MSVTMAGSSIEPTQSAHSRLFPLNRSLAKAYPHKVAVKVPARQEGVMITIVFHKYFQNLKISSVFS
ncbi:hypothetical protein D3C86_2265350 [compost metagenome]